MVFGFDYILGPPTFVMELDKDEKKEIGRECNRLYEDYKSFCKGTMVYNVWDRFQGTDKEFPKFDRNTLSVLLCFGDSSQTFKFMGMDIDEDGFAVVKSPIGNIKVGNMYNIPQNAEEGMATPGEARKLLTALKMGAISTYVGSGITDAVAGLLSGGDDNIRSVILSLIEKNKNNISAASGDSREKVAMKCCVKHWKTVAESYTYLTTFMKALDMWQEIGRKCGKETEYFQKSITGVDKEETITYADFSGFSSVEEVVANNVICTEAYDAAEALLAGTNKGYNYDKEEVACKFLRGCSENVSREDYDTSRYDLGVTALSAASILDGMVYQDEDAEIVRRVYNNSDEEERDELVKTVTKKYKRNYAEYTPKSGGIPVYEFIEDITEIIDNNGVKTVNDYGEEVKVPVLSSEDVGSDGTLQLTDYGKCKIARNDLLRVAKLVGKSLGRVAETL